MDALRRLPIFILFLLSSGWAVACVICAPADAQNTLVRQLAMADRIVLAQPAGASSPVFYPLRPDDLLLSVMNAGDGGWRALGYLPSSREPWLRGLMQPSVPMAVRDLENNYPLVAQAAYDGISAQPYAVLRGLAAELDGRQVAQWVNDPSRSARRPLYYLLLGLSGTAADADAIATQVLHAEPGRSAAELSAMVAALVALRGEAGLAWVEQHFLSAPGMADADVQAALLALSVHGADASAVTQRKVVAAYGRFVKANPQRAGFVASDLAAWGHWEFAEAFGTALRSGGAQVFASRYAMVFYLLRNPRPEARRLLETLRAEKLL